MNTRLGSRTRSFVHRLRFHRPYLESLEQRLPPGDTLALLLGGAAGFSLPNSGSESHALQSSFPNAGSGTYVRETPFRVVEASETEFRGADVPEQEFGNESNESNRRVAVAKPPTDDEADIAWLGNTSARSQRIVSNPESPNRPLFMDAGNPVIAPSGGRSISISPTAPAVAGRAPIQAGFNAEPPATPVEQPADVTGMQQSQVKVSYGRLPISFEANHGQVDDQVDFIARGSGYQMFLTPTEAVMVLEKNSESRIQNSESMPDWRAGGVNPLETAGLQGVDTPRSPESAVVRMQYVGANPNPAVTGQDQLPGIVNYFIGNDPNKWHTDIPTSAKVEYDEVYPGIDLVYYGNAERQLEYDFVVAPGADPRAITLNFAGADKLEVDAAGDLIVHAGGVELRQHKPVLYQEMNGARQEVAGNFALSTQHSPLVTFDVGAYDAGRPLVIDPVLSYSTTFNGFRGSGGIAVDAAGNAHVTGWIQATVASPYYAFVTELNAAGDAEIYTTYFGAADLFYTYGLSIAVDSAGDAYVTGVTAGANFPVQNPALQCNQTGPRAFATKFTPTGAIAYSTCLDDNGPGVTYGKDIAVDATGNAYVAIQDHTSTSNGLDVHVTKLNATGDQLVYSKRFGGNGPETTEGIDVDGAGNVYVSGYTRSTDLATPGAYDTTLVLGTDDVFLTKLNAAGTAIIFSTYLGGDNTDRGYDVAVDGIGNPYVTGMTYSTDFPLENPFQEIVGVGAKVFVTKFNVAGTALAYSTHVGYGGAQSISIGSCGNAYVTGITTDPNFPLEQPVQGYGGPWDSFVTKLSPAGNTLVYSTHLGVIGNTVFSETSIAVDHLGNAYTTGTINSSGGGIVGEVWAKKIGETGNPPPISTSQWTAKGPAPIMGGQTPGNQPVSGRISGIAPHPTNPNQIYVTAASGGVWKTTDGGTNWTPLTDDLPLVPADKRTLVMGAIALAPSDPNVIYAGTGEACNSPGNCYYGRGILKSSNGGATWNLFGIADFDRRTISRIVVHPTDPNTVYAAVADNGFNGTADNTGIWKSTDGAATWVNTTLANGIAHDADATDLVMHPSDPLTLYAAIGEPRGHNANGVYKSTDGGGDWDRLFSSLPQGITAGRIKLAIAPSNAQVIYVSVAGSGQIGTSAYGTLHRLLRSGNGGLRFRNMVNTPNYLGQQGWYDSTLAVSPLNSNRVYAAGQDDIIRSSNGGGTWEYLNLGANGNGPHSDHHATAFDASDRLLDGNDGGLWRLDNAQTGSILWTDLNGTGAAGTTGLQITQFNGIALHPTDPAIAYGASQDNGTEKTTGAQAWTHIGSGDGGFVRVDCSSPATVYHTYQYAEGTFTDFFERSDNGGATWQTKTTGLDPTNPGEFYIPYVMDPSNPSRLLLGTNVVYETVDKADNWTQLGSFVFPASINTLEAAASDVNTIYATANGNFYVSSDRGLNWTSHFMFNANDHFGDLLVDPSDSKVIYAARDRFDDPVNLNVGHVFRSDDGAANWNDITGNLPDVPANALALDPRTEPDTLYVGTDLGVYVSTNLGSSWQPFKTGLPHVMVRELELNQQMNVLAAGTYGRGLWEIGLDLPPPMPPAPPADGRPSLDVARPSPAGAVFVVAGVEPIFRPVRPSATPARRNTDVEVAGSTVTVSKPIRIGAGITKTVVTALPEDGCVGDDLAHLTSFDGCESLDLARTPD